MAQLRYLLGVVFLCLVFSTSAQRTLVYANDNAEFNRALELFGNKKYSVAQRKLERVVKKISDPNSETQMRAEYYMALCALELFNDNAEQLFIDFIEAYPQSPHVPNAIFQLGRYNYRKKRYSSAVKWFEQVDENDLETDEFSEFHFKYGYALFRKEKYPEAQPHFAKAKETESDYKVPAIFYYSHLLYKFSYYEKALEGFESLSNDPSFGNIVPYYITQIYYLQKKYEELVNYGVLFLDSANTKRAPEIARLIAEGYYHKSDYEKCVKYFEVFKEKSSEMDTIGYYQLGYAYYQVGDYGKALQNFQQSTDNETRIGQLSMYYLGDCYLKTANKKAARSAFKFAYKNDHDRTITENALFNYAKLSFELDIDPYHESIIALEDFIAQYPKSPNVAKARKYLLNIYLNTKNYQRAITALEAIDDKSMDLKYAYQKIAFYRGVQVFNEEQFGFRKNDKENYKKAIYFFNKSLEYPEDGQIVAQAKYWSAEAYYRLEAYEKAIAGFGDFKLTNGAIVLDEYKTVDYQLGYAYLGIRDYGPAIRSFRSFAAQKDVDPDKVADALIRTGDSYLLLSKNLTGETRKGELTHAVRYYKLALEKTKTEKDYVYFQMAQAYMLLNSYELHAEALENLIAGYPESKYIDDAKFKAGEVYMYHIENYEVAEKYFKSIISLHQNNVILTQKSYNKLGIIYREQKKFENAITAFETSVKLDPRSSSAQEAIKAHEQTCIYNLGDANRHLAFRSNIGLPEVNEAFKDSATFIAAKKFFIDENPNYLVASKNLQMYLRDFPQGLFKVTAHYYLAESQFALNQYNEALLNYEEVINAPYGEYTERALYVAAKTYLNNEDYQKAIQRYLALEEVSEYDEYVRQARVGLMNAYSAVEDHQNTAKYAALAEADDKVELIVKQRAALLLGKAKLSGFEFHEALDAFNRAVDYRQSSMGAEARYHVAYLHYLQEDYEKATEVIYDVARNYSEYQYWMSKAFLLLSDVHVKQNNLFQAKLPLESIIQNYKGEDLVAEAKQKLEDIKNLEQAAIIKQEKPEEEIQMNLDNGSGNEDLFNEEEEEEELEETPPAQQEVPALPNDTIQR